MQVRFLGAAREVTGSCHEVTVEGRRLLLDCGMWQGARDEAREKNRAFALRGKNIHAILLSHAHIDHSGNLPQLVDSGFRGTVWCTPATRDLARVLLLDSASIAARDVAYLKKRERRAVEPLFTESDVERILAAMKTVPYGTWFEPAPHVRSRFEDAGHIIGSASVHMEIDEPGRERKRLTFTGDFGRRGLPLLRDPAPLPPAEIVLTESTYGGRCHDDGVDPCGAMKTALADAVHAAESSGGKLIIPAFSVGRTQTLLYFLNELADEGRIPRLHVFVDSPLSTEATVIMRRHADILDAETHAKLARAADPLLNDRVHLVESVEQSKRINAMPVTSIIVAPSGMCEFGRVVHHLKHHLHDPRAVIAFVGYQGVHTLGRRILEGVTPVRLLGTSVDVRARVVKMNGFSAHADRRELLEALAPLKADAEHVCVVHGEPDQADALVAGLREAGFRSPVSPEPNDVVEL